MRLVTIEQARQHCRVDSDDDQMLTLYGGAAEDAAQEFLNRRAYLGVAALGAAVL